MTINEQITANRAARTERLRQHGLALTELRIEDTLAAARQLVEHIAGGGTTMRAITGKYAYDHGTLYTTKDDLPEIQAALARAYPELEVTDGCEGMNLTHNGHQYDSTDVLVVHVRGTSSVDGHRLDCTGPLREAPGVDPDEPPVARVAGHARPHVGHRYTLLSI